jgi:oxygen-independent coproporphyrinogen III oxidase
MNPEEKVALAEAHPLDFTIQYPPRREYFQDNFKSPVVPAVVGGADSMLLYVHVPFCKAKCYYCNFAVDVRPDASVHKGYVDRLVKAIEAADELLAPAEIPGIDIGGGTPTILATEQLERILGALQPFKARSPVAFPLSIETTPFIAANDRAKLLAMVNGGVDRISVGLQSMNDEVLRSFNRKEQESVGTVAVENLMSAGFKRVSVDLIFALPGQTDEQWLSDFKRVIALGPDAITTYDCLYRGKGRAMTKRTTDKPSPERYGQLYDAGYALLLSSGYHAPYGSVNFSRHKDETGTSAYFERRLLDGMPYLGIGNYASSLYGDAWWLAPYGVNAWSKAVDSGVNFPVGDCYRLPQEETQAKYLLLSLSFGLIDSERFFKAFGVDFNQRFKREVEYALAKNWLRQEGKKYYIVDGKFSCMPSIRSLFYSARSINWLNQQSQFAQT